MKNDVYKICYFIMQIFDEKNIDFILWNYDGRVKHPNNKNYLARSLLLSILHIYENYSCTKIRDEFKYKSHASVYNAINNIIGFLQVDKSFRKKYLTLLTKLKYTNMGKIKECYFEEIQRCTNNTNNCFDEYYYLLDKYANELCNIILSKYNENTDELPLVEKLQKCITIINNSNCNNKTQISAIILSGLLSKYSMKSPEDQDTLIAMSLELANNLMGKTKL